MDNKELRSLVKTMVIEINHLLDKELIDLADKRIDDIIELISNHSVNNYKQSCTEY